MHPKISFFIVIPAPGRKNNIAPTLCGELIFFASSILTTPYPSTRSSISLTTFFMFEIQEEKYIPLLDINAQIYEDEHFKCKHIHLDSKSDEKV